MFFSLSRASSLSLSLSVSQRITQNLVEMKKQGARAREARVCCVSLFCFYDGANTEGGGEKRSREKRGRISKWLGVRKKPASLGL